MLSGCKGLEGIDGRNDIKSSVNRPPGLVGVDSAVTEDAIERDPIVGGLDTQDVGKDVDPLLLWEVDVVELESLSISGAC